MQNATKKPNCAYYKCIKQPHWKGWGKRYWPEYIWKWMESVKLKSKGTAHKHCTLIDKVVLLDVQINNSHAAYTYTELNN